MRVSDSWLWAHPATAPGGGLAREWFGEVDAFTVSSLARQSRNSFGATTSEDSRPVGGPLADIVV